LTESINEDTLIHWDFKPENVQKDTFMFGGFGPFPLWRTRSTLSPWTWKNIGSYIGNIKHILNVGGIDEPITQELFSPSEVPGKWYMPGGITFIDNDINNVPFREFYDYDELIVKIVFRVRAVLFATGLADGEIGGAMSVFSSPNDFGAVDGLLLSSGSPGFILIRSGQLKPIPYNFQMRKKYLATIKYKFDKLEFCLEDDGGILVEDELIAPKYAAGFRVAGDPIDVTLPTGDIDIEEIIIDGLR